MVEQLLKKIRQEQIARGEGRDGWVQCRQGHPERRDGAICWPCMVMVQIIWELGE